MGWGGCYRAAARVPVLATGHMPLGLRLHACIGGAEQKVGGVEGVVAVDAPVLATGHMPQLGMPLGLRLHACT